MLLESSDQAVDPLIPAMGRSRSASGSILVRQSDIERQREDNYDTSYS